MKLGRPEGKNAAQGSFDLFREQLWAMPANERIAMLICSLVEQDRAALAAPVALVRIAEHMGARLDVERRFKLSDQLRNAADRCERCERLVPR